MSISSDFIHYLKAHLPSATCDAILQALQTPLRDAVRSNALKASPCVLPDLFSEISIFHTPIPWWHGAFWWQSKYADNDFKIGWTVEHLAGALYVQEASSMLPVAALAHVCTEKPNRILDMCAAPGSKTTQLADWMNNEGIIVANELSSSRLKSLAASLLRCGVSNTVLSHQNARVFGTQTPEHFDAILLDAPCTGEGTHRKDATALRDWNIRSIHQTVALQKELIDSAYAALAPGGVLIYSTCTLNHYENHDVCRHLLNAHANQIETVPLHDLFPGVDIACTSEGWLWILPQLFDCEGFFVAAFRKKGTPKPFTIARAITPPPKLIQNEINRLTQENLGAPMEDALARLTIKDVSLVLHPQYFDTLPATLRLNRTGTTIASQKGKTWRLQHEVIHSRNIKKFATLNRAQACEYLMGRDIPNADDDNHSFGQDVAVCYNGIILGLAGTAQGKWKNRYPRDFVSDKVL